jgi:hypothetical protein
MRPRLLISVVSSLLFLLAPSLWAATVQLPAKIADWKAVDVGSGTHPLSDLSASLIAKESGYVAATSKIYRSAEKEAELTLYTFKDSSGAYETYTAILELATPAYSVDLLRVKGNLVLWIRGGGNLPTADVATFEKWVVSASDGVASPPVATYLPEKGRDPLTERYALGPIGFQQAAKDLSQPDAAALVDQAGFNSGAEAMFAKYKSGKDEATLLLIDYPTPQLAELHLKHMQRAILAWKNGASVERKGSLLSIVLAPTSQEYAEKLRGAVNYETQVTWSEPSTTATDPPITSTLVKIIIATGVFMVVTIVVGIAFGGVRIITKRLFPGKVFDRRDQLEVLQLGLSSKPIDPSDMY